MCIHGLTLHDIDTKLANGMYDKQEIDRNGTPDNADKTRHEEAISHRLESL